MIVGVKVKVGVEDCVGVRVLVDVRVGVMLGVSVQEAAVEVSAVATCVARSSSDGAQADNKTKIINIRAGFLI
jgi:hypothetical protein